jgi:hypothetical protein
MQMSDRSFTHLESSQGGRLQQAVERILVGDTEFRLYLQDDPSPYIAQQSIGDSFFQRMEPDDHPIMVPVYHRGQIRAS